MPQPPCETPHAGFFCRGARPLRNNVLLWFPSDARVEEEINSALKHKERRAARMDHDHKTDAIFFDLFYEVLPKQKWKCFRNRNKIF